MVVLVVDDESVSRLIAVHILRGAGHEVIAAEGAEEALELARERRDDLSIVFCDFDMPGGPSGLDLLDSLKTDDAFERCPAFVLVTGVGQVDELDDDRAHEVSGYLTKPVESGELLRMAASLQRELEADS